MAHLARGYRDGGGRPPLLAKVTFRPVQVFCGKTARVDYVGKTAPVFLGIFVYAVAHSRPSAGGFPRSFGVGCTSQHFTSLVPDGQTSERNFAGEGAYFLPY